MFRFTLDFIELCGQPRRHHGHMPRNLLPSKHRITARRFPNGTIRHMGRSNVGGGRMNMLRECMDVPDATWTLPSCREGRMRARYDMLEYTCIPAADPPLSPL